MTMALALAEVVNDTALVRVIDKFGRVLMAEPVFTRSDMRRALSAAIFALDGGAHLADGYDAAFWHGSYTLLRQAIDEHLSEFLRDDDVAEEAIYVEATKLAGERLTELRREVATILANTTTMETGWSLHDARWRSVFAELRLRVETLNETLANGNQRAEEHATTPSASAS
jgi:hypothetical protein